MDGDSGQRAGPGAMRPWHFELTDRPPDFKANAANQWCVPKSALASLLLGLSICFNFFKFLEDFGKSREFRKKKI